jgi:hypothetical protein
VIKQEGYYQYEKLKSSIIDNDGNIILTFNAMIAIEHSGLSKYMSDAYTAPANGLAPFLDITYALPLPVELLNFNAIANENLVDLNWATGSEENVEAFYIEHSLDGELWKNIGFETATNNSSLTTYEAIHETPQIGDNYYRLKIVDFDATYEYSSIRIVNFKANKEVIQVYPNPFEERLVIEIESLKTTKATAYLINATGQIVYNKALQISKNQQIYILNDLGRLEKGIFLLRIEGEGIEFTERVVKL